MQALELRRATTSAQIEDQFVNNYSRAISFWRLAQRHHSDEPLKKKYDTTDAKDLLDKLKAELQRDECQECSQEVAVERLKGLLPHSSLLRS